MTTFFVLLILRPWGCPGITLGVAPFLAFRPLSIHLRQNFLKLCAVHTSSPHLLNRSYGFAAFSALLVLSDSRNFMRALCS